jgi:hypothetical protein
MGMIHPMTTMVPKRSNPNEATLETVWPIMLSRAFVSLLNLCMIRPSGVVSKKLRRVLITDSSKCKCKPVAAVRAATIQENVLTHATKADTTPIALYTDM